MEYRFKIQIREANVPTGIEDDTYHTEWYFVGMSNSNGKDLFTSETYKRKPTLIKTINSLFPEVKITVKRKG